MSVLTRLAVVCLALSALASYSTAQDGTMSIDAALRGLGNLEVIVDTGQLVTMRATVEQPDNAAPVRVDVSCHRGADGGKFDMLAVQDHAARTDDRWGLEIGFCNALVNALAQRKSTQGR